MSSGPRHEEVTDDGADKSWSSGSSRSFRRTERQGNQNKYQIGASLPLLLLLLLPPLLSASASVSFLWEAVAALSVGREKDDHEVRGMMKNRGSRGEE